MFKGKSCEFSGGVGEALILPPEEGDEVEEDSTTPKFQLRENDYVLGERKMGGNAQSVSSVIVCISLMFSSRYAHG